ncbi:uncharacterized protein G2W53_021705 [Senna tora]|uniref:Uncharacterized protein n=1 Tax=Senna tora TaxID=362788 RepID=A0A834TM80_9FABA|nr:uncharacterized protein G2W53_021705 [Senna tora]
MVVEPDPLTDNNTVKGKVGFETNRIMIDDPPDIKFMGLKNTGPLGDLTSMDVEQDAS